MASPPTPDTKASTPRGTMAASPRLIRWRAGRLKPLAAVREMTVSASRGLCSSTTMKTPMPASAVAESVYSRAASTAAARATPSMMLWMAIPTPAPIQEILEPGVSPAMVCGLAWSWWQSCRWWSCWARSSVAVTTVPAASSSATSWV